MDTLQRLTGGIGPDRVIDGVGVEAYERFDRREPGWLKVELDPTEV